MSLYSCNILDPRLSPAYVFKDTSIYVTAAGTETEAVTARGSAGVNPLECVNLHSGAAFCNIDSWVVSAGEFR